MNTVILVLVGGLLVVGCGGVSEDAAEQETAVSSSSVVDNEVATSAEPSTSGTDSADPPVTTGGDREIEAESELSEEKPPLTSEEPGNGEPPVEDEGDSVEPTPVEHPNQQVAVAMTDLVDRLGIDAASIEVVSVEEVTWPDGSIGCPQPGMRYTQALVNGSRIVLRTGGADYQYNSGGGREPFYCANPGDPVPGGGDYGDI